jgi:hypothetical protein
VKEAAETVVAVVAQQASDPAGPLAVINRESLAPTVVLLDAADRTSAVLCSKQNLVLFIADAIQLAELRPAFDPALRYPISFPPDISPRLVARLAVRLEPRRLVGVQVELGRELRLLAVPALLLRGDRHTPINVLMCGIDPYLTSD